MKVVQELSSPPTSSDLLENEKSDNALSDGEPFKLRIGSNPGGYIVAGSLFQKSSWLSLPEQEPRYTGWGARM